MLILKSELDVPILKVDNFAVTLLRFIGADFIARKMRQKIVLRYSSRAMFAVTLLRFIEADFIARKMRQKKLSCDFSKTGTDLQTGSQISTDIF